MGVCLFVFHIWKKNKTVVDQIVLEKLKKKIQQQQNYCGSFLEKTITVNRSKTKNMSLLILPKYMSSWCTINENEIHIRKTAPFQSGGLGKGGTQKGNYSSFWSGWFCPSCKGGCHLHLFKAGNTQMELRIIFRRSPRCPHCGPFSTQKQWNPPVLIFTAKVLLLNNRIFANSMPQIQQ